MTEHFDQVVEYVDADGVHYVDLAVHALESAPTLSALSVGYAHASTLGRSAELDAASRAAVQSAAGNVYDQDVVDHEIVGLSDPAQIVNNLLAVRSYPDWGAGLDCVADVTTVFYAGTLWLCRVSHTTIADPNWTPGTAPNLWQRFYSPADPEWSYPTAYVGDNTAGIGNGDVVTYQGVTYRCLQSHTSNSAWYPSAPGIINVLWVLVP